MRKFWIAVSFGIAVLGAGLALRAAEPAAAVALKPSAPVDVKNDVEGSSTLGGMQFWTDELVFHDWRIQRNSFTEHCRLLNPKDERVAFGSYDECRAKLDEIKTAKGLEPLKPKVVIVLHGLFGYRGRMVPLVKYLKEKTDYEVLNVGYASTRGDVSSHAASLKKVIERLEGVEEINFVAHSLGNLIVRRYLSDSLGLKGEGKIDPRIKRMVMLAPPNQGAYLATEIGDNGLARIVSGGTAKELGVSFRTVRDSLATPSFEFGILAACCSTPKGGNPALPGDDDWIVCVEETKLPGACDYRVLSCLHQTITHLPQTHACVVSFLEHGYFTTEAERQAIAASPAEKKP